MKEEVTKWQQVQRYSELEMTPNESDVFQKVLLTDSEMSAMLEAYELTSKVVIIYESAKIKAKITRDLKKQKVGKTWWTVGILLLVSTGLVGYLFLPRSKNVQTNTAVPPVSENVTTSALVADAISPQATSQPTKSPNLKKSIPTLPTYSTTTFDPPAFEQASVLEEMHLAKSEKDTEPLSTSIVVAEESKAMPISCDDTHIMADFSLVPSCENNANGEIVLKQKSIHGGTPPYFFALSEQGPFSSLSIKELPSGTYDIYVKDGKNCLSKLDQKAVVATIACHETNAAYTYSPVHDPAWQIPYRSDKTPSRFQIFDKGGKEIVSWAIQAGYPSEWSGESMSGSKVPAGYYIYFVEYTDQTTDKGSISILR